MSVSVIVPFRGDGAQRTRNWEWLRRHYEQAYPDWELIVGECPDGAWSKGRAVNEAAARASGDVLVVADADVVLPFGALQQAVDALESAPWVIPHRMVFRLSDKGTQALMNGEIAVAATCRRTMMVKPPKLGPPGGGVAVVGHEDFTQAGGVDPRFEGWGGEDISFARALDTLAGPHRRLEEVLWHLWHRPMERRPRQRASEASEALANRYLDANGDPVAMKDLCEDRYEGIMGGGAVVTTKGVVADTPFDERFTGWG